MRFAIRVEEIIGKTIIVQAEDIEDAIYKVECACNNDEIFIDGIDDFVERRVCPSDSFIDGVVPDDADVSFYEHLEER